jgi:pyruvate/2-oxoglutarate/acetoin dehydrogenase E1 component
MRAIVEFQFGDFISVAMDQLTHQAAMLRSLTAGQSGRAPSLCSGIGECGAAE